MNLSSFLIISLIKIMFRSFISDATHYMKVRNVGKELQMKIMRYLEYVHCEETSGFQRGEVLLKSLSLELKNELQSDIFSKNLNQIMILKDNFSPQFLKELSYKFQERFYAPDDIVFKVADI